MVWDKKSGYAHLFGITPNEKGNLPYKTSLDLDEDQVEEIETKNTFESMYKHLYK
jgi:hypothetical protein